MRATEEGWNQYAKYADLVWKNKIQTVAFIILKNTSKYEKLSSALSLFDIKTYTGKWGVYNLLDWSTIEGRANIYNK